MAAHDDSETLDLEEEIKAFKELRILSPISSPKGGRLNPLNVDLIIKKLLSYLPLCELKAAREVNRHWNDIATQFFYPYCSKCTLSFNEDNYWTNARNYGIEELKDFIHLVLMSEECPFKAYDLGNSIITSANEATIIDFFDVCGQYMEKLTIRDENGKKIFRKALPDHIQLEELTTLRLHLLQTVSENLDNFFNFVKVLIKASPNLEHFALICHNQFENGESVQALIDAITLCDLDKITQLDIEAQMNDTHLVQLSTLGLTLKHLSMDFWGSQFANSRGMKLFLESQSSTLESFKLSDVAMSSVCVIEFPCMKELKTLKIKGSMLGRISVTFPHISFVDQFPKLKTLSFSELFGEWEEFLKTGIKPSMTIEELKLPCDFSDSMCLQRAAYLFPCLKRLEVPYNTQLMNVIYDMMPNLEELTINTRLVSLIDDVITGIPQDICTEINKERCYERALKDLDDYQFSKSITSLKKLKTLRLKCKRASDPVELTEISFYLALFHMNSLQYLDFGLRPLMLSRDCIHEIKKRFRVTSLHIHQ